MMTLSASKIATRLALVACVGLSLSACSRLTPWASSNRPVFDGQYFRAKVAFEKEAPAAFTVTVRDPGKSLAGAREAGRLEATTHCIAYFGDSRIEWGASNPDAEEGALLFQDGSLVMAGTCRGW
ncbi:hypothetical protein [Pseudooceanicola marinus]|uniref:hypothetical protein n=1 Tax=Pseudooceanicola marinus TaxID=396013 RepID=UPI001CD34C9C|nr:hypothetical protein [Pseudooceanicola marinus]MCA1335332.1 hypothetical protein [Pseudooceanicola marinus]